MTTRISSNNTCSSTLVVSTLFLITIVQLSWNVSPVTGFQSSVIRTTSSLISQKTTTTSRPPFVVIDTKLQLREGDAIIDDSDSSSTSSSTRKSSSFQDRIINFSALKRLRRRGVKSKSSAKESSTPTATTTTEITTMEELEQYYTNDNDAPPLDYDALINNLSVKGSTQIIGSPTHPTKIHPVLQLLHQRRRTNSPLTPTTQTRPDKLKVALVIEGGGMRGCVTAGMVAAIHYLGLEDTIDVIYGSSAGTIIGAYFNTRQLPFFGPEIYYDSLTTAGRRFIDTRRLLRVVGLGLVDPRLAKDVVMRRGNGKPVLSLDFLLRETMMEKKPLDWEKFVEMQKVQPLKVVASNLKRKDIVVLEMANGGFNSIEELSKCMHASCLIPGIAGPLMNINMSGISNQDTPVAADKPQLTTSEKFTLGNDLNNDAMEPLADALVFQPLPYRVAIEEGATHVLVLRSKPDGADVTGKASRFDPLILKRFFLRKNKLPDTFTYLRNKFHKKLYAEQVLELNKAAEMVEEEEEDSGGMKAYEDTTKPHVMTVALPPGSPEVGRLETGRQEIFEGVKRGFARTYDALVEDTNERGRGGIVAEQIFPEEILDYDPLEIDSKDEAAFDFFLKQKLAMGEGYAFPSSLGKSALDAGLPR